MDLSQKEGRLLMAIEALKKDPQLGIATVTKIYNVIRSTLRLRLSGILSRNDISANLRKFTDSEEKVIIQYIIDLNLRAFLSRISDVEDMANLLLV
jgi:hypothetical protein